MKIMKWLLIVLLVLAGLFIIVPVFLPSAATVKTQIEISLSPELIFQNVGLFTDREKWDPWLQMEPGAKATITPKQGMLGSTYKWEGEKIGQGKMQVDSVHFPDYIRSNIWFGDIPEPSGIEWNLVANETGTTVKWQFTSEGSYPFGRVMIQFMKRPIKKAFDVGLKNLKTYLEENPPILYKLSKIDIQKSYATNTITLPVEGNMEEIGQQMSEGFPKLFEETGKQGLNVTGPAFTHYLDYDAVTGFSHALLAVPVDKKGMSSGQFKPKFYEEEEAVVATQYGKYEYLKNSYDSLLVYVNENKLKVKAEAFEVYLTTMNDSPNPMAWKTLVAFPLLKN